jgi:pre-mRNA-splicing factor ATP-dependent RNA helicase DHX38/PRP16
MKKSRERLFGIAGSRMGDLLGVKNQIENEADDSVVDESGDVDYKSGSFSAAFAGKKNEAVSEFAKTKTIK